MVERLLFQSGHPPPSQALCAMALAVLVRGAARMPQGSPERRALARAARELREVV